MSVITKLNVLRGYPPFDSNALTLSVVPTAGQAILSGMIISIDISTTQFVKGVAAGQFPCWAVQDQSAPDVAYSGKLTGLVGLFGYEIETPYFTTGTYKPGYFVKAATAGDVGKVTVMASGDLAATDIVGICSRGSYVNKDGNSVVSLFTTFYPKNILNP